MSIELAVSTCAAGVADLDLADVVANDWVAAVQDLQHNGLQATVGDGGSRLSTGQRGYLRCLLHMGHLHSQLAHVNGWAAQAPGVAFIISVYYMVAGHCQYLSLPLIVVRWLNAHAVHPCTDAAKCQLAAAGVAAAWRLGQWDALPTYIERTDLGYDSLEPEDRWEVSRRSDRVLWVAF